MRYRRYDLVNVLSIFIIIGTLVLWEVSAVSDSNVYSCNSTEDIITMNIGEVSNFFPTLILLIGQEKCA